MDASLNGMKGSLSVTKLFCVLSFVGITTATPVQVKSSQLTRDAIQPSHTQGKKEDERYISKPRKEYDNNSFLCMTSESLIEFYFFFPLRITSSKQNNIDCYINQKNFFNFWTFTIGSSRNFFKSTMLIIQKEN